MAEMEGFEPPDGLTRQLISSQPRYDHFDTSPRCIFKALRVSVRLRAECRNRRTKRRKTVDIQLLKSVDNPEKPEISRVFGDGSSTDLLDFECCTFDHSDNSPCLFSSGFLSRNLLKNSMERKQERRQKIFDFEIFCVEEYQGESGGRNSQIPPKFRVVLVATTSIHLHAPSELLHSIISCG